MSGRAAPSADDWRLVLAAIQWPTSASRVWADQACPTICAHPDVLAFVLIGSSVRPVVQSQDLDCLLIHRCERIALPPAPLEIDLRAYPGEQVDTLIAEGHDLLGWAVRLGRLACERDAYWTDLTERWQDRLPFSSAEIAEERAVRAERLLVELREMGDEDAALEQHLAVLTHRGRAVLLRAGVFPASRPELPSQLRGIGATRMADEIAAALDDRRTHARSRIGPAPHRVGDAA